METFETIFTRRSVRRFLSTPIEKDKIDKILRAAMAAPSAMNQQPWHFIVIEKEELRNTIAKLHPHSAMSREAPLVIIPCAELSNLKSEVFWPADLAAATENLLLAVRDLGLGAVWCGLYPKEELIEKISNALHIPATFVPYAVIPIGYTTVAQAAQDRFNARKIHYNGW